MSYVASRPRTGSGSKSKGTNPVWFILAAILVLMVFNSDLLNSYKQGAGGKRRSGLNAAGGIPQDLVSQGVRVGRDATGNIKKVFTARPPTPCRRNLICQGLQTVNPYWYVFLGLGLVAGYILYQRFKLSSQFILGCILIALVFGAVNWPAEFNRLLINAPENLSRWTAQQTLDGSLRAPKPISKLLSPVASIGNNFGQWVVSTMLLGALFFWLLSRSVMSLQRLLLPYFAALVIVALVLVMGTAFIAPRLVLVS